MILSFSSVWTFKYMINIQCVDIMEPIDAEATRPYHYRPKPDCAKAAKTTPEPASEKHDFIPTYTD